MKKLVCMMIALLMCVSIILPAMAEDSIYIPSLGVKVKSAVMDGKDVTSCFVAATVSEAKDGTAAVSKEESELLISLYDTLSKGEVLLPLEQEYEYSDMSALGVADGDCAALAEELKKDGTSVTLVLEPNLPHTEKLTMLTYVGGKWIQVGDAKNNDDGTITCTLEDVGPIAFVVLDEKKPNETKPEELTPEEETTVTSHTEVIFMPSIGYKDGPEIVDVTSNIVLNGNVQVGDDKIDNCIIGTSVEEAKEKKTDISQDDRDLLIELYTKLANGSMTLPLDKDYVIRDLLDVSFFQEACREQPGHQEKIECLKEPGVTLSVTFKMGISADTNLIVMGYMDGKWAPVEEVINNGDGTVTCVMEDECPLAFVVENAKSTPASSPWTGDAAGNSLGIWVTLMVVCAAGVAALVILKKKHN